MLCMRTIYTLKGSENMLEGVIVSIFEGVIISCGKTFFQKLSLILKSHKIKKELKKKMNSLILDSQGNAEYFNACRFLRLYHPSGICAEEDRLF